MSATAIVDKSRELERLVKVLEMTNSPYEAEVLAAVGRAKSILKRHETTYQEIFEEFDEALEQRDREISRLSSVVVSQKRRLSAPPVSNPATPTTPARSRSFGAPFSGSVNDLKRLLLSKFPLKKFERMLLEQTVNIKPKTKEAYMVLICAKRYGLGLAED